MVTKKYLLPKLAVREAAIIAPEEKQQQYNDDNNANPAAKTIVKTSAAAAEAHFRFLLQRCANAPSYNLWPSSAGSYRNSAKP